MADNYLSKCPQMFDIPKVENQQEEELQKVEPPEMQISTSSEAAPATPRPGEMPVRNTPARKKSPVDKNGGGKPSLNDRALKIIIDTMHGKSAVPQNLIIGGLACSLPDAEQYARKHLANGTNKLVNIAAWAKAALTKGGLRGEGEGRDPAHQVRGQTLQKEKPRH